MINYADYTLTEDFKKTIREEYVRNWISAQLNATPSHQPTQAEIEAQYTLVPASEFEKYRMSAYTKYVVTEAVPVPAE